MIELGLRDKVAVFLMFPAILLPVIGYFTIRAPAEDTYNSKFASLISMVYNQNTLEGMKEQATLLWAETNLTFVGTNIHSYDVYFYHLNITIQRFKAQYERLKANPSNITLARIEYEILKLSPNNLTLTEWYCAVINYLRAEDVPRLSSAIADAWFRTFAPSAYWFYTFVFAYELLIWIIISSLLIRINR